MKSLFLIILVLLICILSACSSKDTVAPSENKKEKIEVSTQKSKDNQEEKDAITQEQPAKTLSDKSSLFYGVIFKPEKPHIGDSVKISIKKGEVNVDRNTASIASINYEWRKNGKELSEKNDTLKITNDFKRGDKIEATVTLEEDKRSKSWFIRFDIVNSPPEIVSVSKVTKLNGTLTFQVKAKDSDGDELKYSIKSPSQGVSINSYTGQVSVPISDGKTPSLIVIAVTDGNGGETVHTMNVVSTKSLQ